MIRPRRKTAAKAKLAGKTPKRSGASSRGVWRQPHAFSYAEDGPLEISATEFSRGLGPMRLRFYRAGKFTLSAYLSIEHAAKVMDDLAEAIAGQRETWRRLGLDDHGRPKARGCTCPTDTCTDHPM
jgi:hypothetical protein